MCGFAGILGFGASVDHSILESMADRIRHRGPDDSGVWIDAEAGVGLTHRRLSIVDLSAAGHQPMLSACGRFVIAFNGEIYNHLEIREALGGEGVNWRGHSDTETLLAGFVRWGIEDTLRRAVGMFAIALWDRQDRVLRLVRDRMGEKPLYYGWQGGVFLFGSELKALRAHPSFRAGVDRQALKLFMRYSYIPAPFSIHEGIKKLQPGSVLTLPWSQGEARCRLVEAERFWRLEDVARAGLASPFEGSESEAVDHLERVLLDAVRLQQVADVPLGALLSGGVDSSTIVALMQSTSSRRVKTFSVGFDEREYDESPYGQAVARHLGTEHTELKVQARDALDLIPKLSQIYDEPFADASQVPTYLVSKLARSHVTVALSGDAGDELFCGYNRYLHAASLDQFVGRVPLGLRRFTAQSLTALSIDRWNRINSTIQFLIPESRRIAHAGEKVHRLAAVIQASDAASIHQLAVSRWSTVESLVLGAGAEPQSSFENSFELSLGSQVEHSMMLTDSLGYLPDDILAKVDRASMAVSLEARVPMLDHRVVEFAWRIPLGLKLRQGQGKWVLRQVLYRHVPRALIQRPKKGFSVPIDQWLRGALRPWAEALLDPTLIRSQGFFDPEPIRRVWIEHQSGSRNHQDALWNVLMFQAWLEHNQGDLADLF